MGLKASGADRLFKGGLLNGNHWAALFYNNSGTQTEISGNGYARVALTLASWQRDPGTRRYENANDIIFPVPTPAAWPAINQIGLFSVATGGTPFVTVDITATDPPQIGAQVRWVDEMVKWGATSGGLTDVGSLAMLSEGLLSGTRAVSFHSASPNSSNRIGNSVSVSASNFTETTVSGSPNRRRSRNNARISTNVFTANEPTPTHGALRDGSAAGAGILFSQSLSGSPSDPVIGDLFTIAGNGMVMNLNID